MPWMILGYYWIAVGIGVVFFVMILESVRRTVGIILASLWHHFKSCQYNFKIGLIQLWTYFKKIKNVVHITEKRFSMVYNHFIETLRFTLISNGGVVLF